MPNTIQKGSEKKQSRCHWCKHFLSDKTKLSTIKEPNIFYCHNCYQKGLEEEKEAMGFYDTN